MPEPKISSESVVGMGGTYRKWGEGRGKADVDVKLGGNQIEYEDEDPIVRKMFAEACAKAGVDTLMAKYYAA